MNVPPSNIPPYKKIARLSTLLVFGANLIGALLSYIYLAILAPDPTSPNAIFNTDFTAIIPTILGTMVLLAIGTIFGRRSNRFLPTWYEKMRQGAQAADMPEDARREVLNYPFATALISITMWFVAGLTFGLFLAGSWRSFWGIFAVGGVLTSVIVFFSFELLWRGTIELFFPLGNVGTVKAMRLSVLRRLLLTFFLVSIYPLGMITLLSLDRARQMLNASDPALVMRNLLFAEGFILLISIGTGIGLALLTTRSIMQPLSKLMQAMSRVEKNDLTVRAPVMSNDELGYLTERFNAMVEGLRRGELLRNLLNIYVSPEVARAALERGTSLGGQVVECSILFSDIRGFTTISESLPPEKLIELINRYMSRMVGIIVANSGIVNKFGGDSLLAVFGTPLNPSEEHAAAAVRTALAMMKELNGFNAEQTARGETELHIGIGIATGPVVAGNIGGESRIEYTVIGDTVNMAARLQELTKEFKKGILVTNATIQSATRSLSLAAEPLPPITVRGKTEPVKIFAILSDL